MKPAPTIWIVDDDPGIRLFFGRILREAGYGVTACEDGLVSLGRLKTESPALIVLDVDMPRLDGWQTLKRLRRDGCTRPVLMLTHANHVDSRVRGLENGADDYLGKPCEPNEFLARVRALLRRAGPPAGAGAAPLRFGEVSVDLESRTATSAGSPLRLTRTEYALLTVLRENVGKPVSREAILERVWAGQTGYSHALDNHVWRLRRKLGDTGEEPRWIRNVSGMGYVMTATE
jgi:DNA-binding response OmpR family regulator